ncbi:unnamed protein product [Schistosoma haematobium]|nr:unnamed protein product [Schistosoma haematobium]CAH8632319.1 unnamed protein product [Schistosoma haematobium]
MSWELALSSRSGRGLSEVRCVVIHEAIFTQTNLEFLASASKLYVSGNFESTSQFRNSVILRLLFTMKVTFL